MGRGYTLSVTKVREFLEVLKEEKMKLRQEFVYCGSERISERDVSVLRDLGVSSNYLVYPVCRVVMYFYNRKDCRVLSLSSHYSGVARIRLEVVEKSCELIESESEYSVFCGECLESTVDLDSYELLCSTPFMYNLLREYKLISNLTLWKLFNSYTYREACARYSIGKLEGLPDSMLCTVRAGLKNCKLSIESATDLIEVYVDRLRSCRVVLVRGIGYISVYYYDKYSEQFNRVPTERIEVSTEFSLRTENCSNCRIYHKEDVSRRWLVKILRDGYYSLDGIGVLFESLVLRFRSARGYLYIMSYFDGCYMVQMLYSYYIFSSINVNGKSIKICNVEGKDIIGVVDLLDLVSSC